MDTSVCFSEVPLGRHQGRGVALLAEQTRRFKHRAATIFSQPTTNEPSQTSCMKMLIWHLLHKRISELRETNLPEISEGLFPFPLTVKYHRSNSFNSSQIRASLRPPSHTHTRTHMQHCSRGPHSLHFGGNLKKAHPICTL